MDATERKPVRAGKAGEIIYEGAQLYPKQRDALFDPARISCTEASAKSGKTVGALAWLFEQALKTGSEGRNYWWIAPVYGQAEIGYRRMKRKVPKSMYKSNESKMTMTLVNGSVLHFRSAERPDGLYGEDVYAAVLDEASRMREAAWIAVRSTLTATRGPVRLIGNVRGKKNWFFKLSRIAEAGAEGMSYHRITAYDAAEAGVLSTEEVELARQDFERLGRTDVFEELYMAKATGGSSNPFGYDAIQNCIIPYLSTNRAAVAGVDLAGRGAANIVERDERADRDYTAIVMLDREGNVCHLDRFQLPHGETEARILATVQRTACLMDSTGSGDPVVEWCQRTGKMNVLGFNFSTKSKQELMERLAIAIQNEEIHFPEGVLVDELESFTFEHTRSGMRYVASPGNHDDLVCALALAVWKMPWRRGHATVPSGIPSTSRWTSDNGSSEAGRRYLESKPSLVSGLMGETSDAPPKVPLPVPDLIVGTGAGKWR